MREDMGKHGNSLGWHLFFPRGIAPSLLCFKCVNWPLFIQGFIQNR